MPKAKSIRTTCNGCGKTGAWTEPYQCYGCRQRSLLQYNSAVAKTTRQYAGPGPMATHARLMELARRAEQGIPLEHGSPLPPLASVPLAEAIAGALRLLGEAEAKPISREIGRHWTAVGNCLRGLAEQGTVLVREESGKTLYRLQEEEPCSETTSSMMMACPSMSQTS